MAIASIGAFTENTHWDQIVAPGVVDTVFRNSHFLPLIPRVDQPGGSTTKWRAITAGNTSAEVFTEGQTVPQGVAQTTVMASLSFIDFRIAVEVSKQLQWAIRGMAIADQFHAINMEIQKAAEDLRDLMNTTFLGSSNNNGLQLAIDSTGVYAGLDRSTYTTWAAYEDAVGGGAYADLTTMRRALVDAERGAPDMVLLLTNPTEVDVIQGFPGAPGASNNSVRFELTQDAGALQLAPTRRGTMVGEARLVGVPDSGANLVFGLGPNNLDWVVHEELDRETDLNGVDTVIYLMHSSTIRLRDPRQAGKLTGF